MNRKGISTVVAILLGALIALAATGVFIYFYNKGKGTGDEGTVSAVEAAAPIELTKKKIKYVEITIDGSEYYHNNKQIEIDDLIELINKKKEKSAVRIIDKDASQKAYKQLTDSLHDNGIKYIEGEENEE